MILVCFINKALITLGTLQANPDNCLRAAAGFSGTIFYFFPGHMVYLVSVRSVMIILFEFDFFLLLFLFSSMDQASSDLDQVMLCFWLLYFK